MDNFTTPETPTAKTAMSRKEFLSLTGRTLAAGAVAGIATACAAPASMQSSQNTAASPPARVPASPMEPIQLEKIKGEGDVEEGPLPTPLPPDQRVGYAFVGLGHFALGQLIPSIASSKKSKLVALVSGSPDKMQRVAQQYGVKPENCYSYETFDSIKNNPEVDVIYIVLPNGLHKEYVIRGARAGKHIMCEKPMATSAADCREMIAACNANNVKLMVAYRIQFQPHNRKVKELLKQKDLGETKFIQATNCQSAGNPDHWRLDKELAGGGPLPDLGVYCTNTTRFILGMEPTEVFAWQYASPGDPRFTEVEEMVSWQMKFPDGIMANCVTSYDAHDNKSYDVFCEKGWLKLENAYSYHGQELHKSEPEGKIKNQQNLVIAETNQFNVEMDHFADCIINNKRPYATGEDGLQDLVIIEAIYESARTGRPVKIPAADPAAMHGPEPELDK